MGSSHAYERRELTEYKDGHEGGRANFHIYIPAFRERAHVRRTCRRAILQRRTRVMS